ncbi:hypothetical protein IAE57_08655 [Stenotrophomonas sp. S48]|uniref:hypothetical protein n=1 Tax=unclassified Stenotrophomonas TaxID=196198 RepID=UPI0018FF7020|nr:MULTISPECIES: hypothetical protein [unclassified Stenotrophomonas]MBK0026234.1 hypothetical protein [Stenotrophomonas sp. S48]MBK0049608.1 hypothetical protein [Stenotrophomonas sp. S49]
MERAQKTLTMADVAGWGSALVTFGLIQGAFYLQAYWGHFGLDPFQFVAVSELAVAGLAGIGMVLFLMLFAMLFGGWLDKKVTDTTPRFSPLVWSLAVIVLIGSGLCLWWTNGWPVLIGVALTGVCALTVQMSPVLPAAVKKSPWLVYVLVMLVYVPITSSWIGADRATKITSGESKFTVSVIVDGRVQGGFTLVGRLGDSYVLWDPARKSAILLPVDGVSRLESARLPRPPTNSTQTP